jgi:predicted ATP-binding protein involved in virulence
MENFITEITVNKSRNIENLTIPLSSDKRQHLILTGKNGSGKTSLLLELNKFLSKVDKGETKDYQKNYKRLIAIKEQLQNSNLNEQQTAQLKNQLEIYQNWYANFGGTKIDFSNSDDAISEKGKSGEFLLAFFDSKRHTSLTIPQGIKKVSLKKKYGLAEKASPSFIQYIVNLKADRSFARDDEETETVTKIDEWFCQFENRLKTLFDDDDLKLKFDRKSYNFNIESGQGEPFNFNTLSDGYSAIISIVSELLLRMEAHNRKSYDLEGIVIIDEIETHLHVELQKIVLPFLIDFFPKLQFIVTTHSPFILSSISNATICDLESKVVTNDLTSYSYDALIESYFRTDKYSDEVKTKVSDFESLIEKTELNETEKESLKILRNYFAHSPKYLSDELIVKLQEIALKEITTKRKK